MLCVGLPSRGGDTSLSFNAYTPTGVPLFLRRFRLSTGRGFSERSPLPTIEERQGEIDRGGGKAGVVLSLCIAVVV